MPCSVVLLNPKELVVSRRTLHNLRGEVRLLFYYEKPELYFSLLNQLLPWRASRLKAIK